MQTSLNPEQKKELKKVRKQYKALKKSVKQIDEFIKMSKDTSYNKKLKLQRDKAVKNIALLGEKLEYFKNVK